MWMMAAMLATTVASSAMGAKGALDQGVYGQNAANAQATDALRQQQELKIQAEEVELQASQDQAIREAKLGDLLGANAVALVKSGITSDSASVEAIRERNLELVGRDIANIKYMGAAKAGAMRRQASYQGLAAESYMRAGREARSAAEMAAWGTLIKGASSIATNAYFGGGGGKGKS